MSGLLQPGKRYTFLGPGVEVSSLGVAPVLIKMVRFLV